MPALARRQLPQPLMRQPRCPSCASPMDLARSAQDTLGVELRTFECTNCEHAESWGYKKAS
jgi:hypothetical protein